MNKKTILGIVFAIIVIVIIGAVYFFAGNNNNTNNNQTISDPNVNLGSNNDSNSDEAENNNETENTENNTSKGLKTLVVYFSVPETNNPNNMTRDEDNSTVVVNGEVLGNTQYVAELIKERTSADIFRLEPTNAYPTNHSELLKRAQEEMSNNVKPEINGKIENFDQYDVIYVGYPIWNADIPPIIETFLSEYKFDGKTVVPFCTHGGSGLSGTPSTIAKLIPSANVIQNGFSISRSSMNNAISAVESWLKEIYN